MIRNDEKCWHEHVLQGYLLFSFGRFFILFFRQGSFSKASNFSSSFRIVSSKKNLLKQVWQGDSRGDREKQKHHFGSIYPLKNGLYISPTTEETTSSISSRNMASRQKSTRAYVCYNILHIYKYIHTYCIHIYIYIIYKYVTYRFYKKNMAFPNRTT